MKILIVQLLRLGDILLSAPIIEGLKRKYPGAEIHFLGFKNFSQVEELFQPGIRWHWIDRDELQSAIGDASRPFFHAADLLEWSLKDLKAIRFDHVYNLTQTRLSGWICSQLNAEQLTGLRYDRNANAHFGSPWFKYLNDHIAAGRGEVFHFVDLFRFACEVEDQPTIWDFRRHEPSVALSKPYVLIQPLTSDEKKTYPLSHWRSALATFSESFSECTIGVLASPKEADPLRRAFSNLPQVHVLACSLTEALSLMDKAALLVTGDTSIKHLACASRVPVLELSLGSSDHRKTGIYKSGSWILQAKTPCAPCAHSAPCSQATHACALGISPESVAEAMGAILKGNSLPRFTPQLQCLRTFISPMGFWISNELSESPEPNEIAGCIEKSSWKFFLQREFQNPLAPFGSESLRLQRTFSELFPNVPAWVLSEKLGFLESEAETASARVEGILKSQEEEWPAPNQKLVSLQSLRRLQMELDETVRRAEIKLKLIRSLKSQINDQEGVCR